MKKIAMGVWVALLAGCTALPADYAATLSDKDPKWTSPACRTVRAQAANYREQNVNWAAGALIGPYGLAIVAAGKEHQEKQRIRLAREVHIKCSSQPVPGNLERYLTASRKSTQ